MSSTESRETLPPEPRLPPVEPPSAGFIVQLFVIPALIVIIIFVAGAAIKWLVERDSNPESYLYALERHNDAQWQAAHDLADLLRSPRNEHLKRDGELAGKLAAILNRQIDAGAMDEHALKLRVYLCHALGEFQQPEVVDVLLRAAKTQRDAQERVVQFSALKGLAVYLSSAPESGGAVSAKILPDLLKSSRDDEPLIRSTAAFALGALGNAKATERLELMLSDRHPDVRYNAATMLARRGNPRAVDVLVEMLDPQQHAALVLEQETESRELKRDLILVNGLRATSELAARNSQTDLTLLRTAAQRLTGPELPAGIRLKAGEVLIELDRRKG